MIERDSADGASILNLRFALFNTWMLIDNPREGRFLERIAPGAFKKTIRENVANIRAVLSHGSDPSLGNTVLGTIEGIEEEADGASARVSLFESVPALLLDGLRAGVYGASFRGSPIKNQVVHRPGRSAHNPDGIEEVTRLEIRLADVGPTPFAQYAGTTAKIDGAMALASRWLPEAPYLAAWRRTTVLATQPAERAEGRQVIDRSECCGRRLTGQRLTGAHALKWLPPAPSEPRDATLSSRDPTVHRPFGLFAGASDLLVSAQVGRTP